MKIYLGPYHNYWGPYQIVDAIFFWQEKYPEDKLAERWDYKLNGKLSDWLADTWVNTVCEWVQSKRLRTVKVKIHKYDTWNVDSTLAVIILPLLKKLKETKQGSAVVELEDVPEHMRTTSTEDYDSQYTLEFYNGDQPKTGHDIHTRWDWVLDEMIWAFEQLQPDCDWEQQYWITNPELDFEEHTEDGGQTTIPVRWKVKGECDWVGRQAHQDRISNGLRLFGAYYQGLWS